MGKVASTLWKTKVNGEEMEFMSCPYMVGDILTTTNNIDPNTRYKGTTWEKIEEETFLMSASDNYKVKSTGGENTHTLTVDEMPSHKHDITRSDGGIAKKMAWGTSSSNTGYISTMGSTYYKDMDITSTGGSKAHNNMPKFFAVYFWLRVA